MSNYVMGWDSDSNPRVHSEKNVSCQVLTVYIVGAFDRRTNVRFNSTSHQKSRNSSNGIVVSRIYLEL